MVLHGQGCGRFRHDEKLELCLQLFPGDNLCRPQIGNRLRGFNLVDPYHFFNRTTCTRTDFTPEIHSPDPEVF